MFTRQYYFLQAIRNLGNHSASGSTYIPIEAERTLADIKNLSGTNLAEGYWYPYNSGSTSTVYGYSLAMGGNYNSNAPNVSYGISTLDRYKGTVIVIGSGTTPATLDDYALVNKLSSGFSRSVIHSNVFYDAENDKWYFDETVIFTCNTENELSIGEWGIYTAMSTNAASHICVYREVLPSPVVLEIGDAFKLKVRFSVDAHSPEVIV